MQIKTKEQVQIEQQILYNLSQILEAFPQYNFTQHLCHILRKKSELKDVYFWGDEKLLSKVEEYYEELKTELINDKQLS